MPSLTFDPHTSANEFAVWLESQTTYKHCEMQLLSLLEGNAFTQGLRSRELARLRGYVLASLERLGAPDYAIPIAIENLTVGIDPYVVAASAKALRGWKKSSEIVPALLIAMENVASYDDFVSFDSFRPSYPLQNPTTAVAEIFETIYWLGNAAAPYCDRLGLIAESNSSIPSAYRDGLRDFARSLQVPSAPAEEPNCCSKRLQVKTGIRYQLHPNTVEAEDESGKLISLAFWIGQAKYTVVTFFYSRCDNPRKCSANITKLASLQRLVHSSSFQESIQFAAITYDPAFDREKRLHNYGLSRGFKFDDRSKFFRITKGHDQLQNALALLVEYSGSVVSQHAVQIFVLDEKSQLVSEFSRLPWTPEDIIKTLKFASKSRSNWYAVGGVSGLLSSAFVAILPKCPFCWSMYLSAIGVTTASSIVTWRGITAISFVAFGILLLVSYRQCSKTEFWVPLLICLVGVGLLGGSMFHTPLASYRSSGLACVIAASLLGHWSMASQRYPKLFRICKQNN